MIDKVKYLEEKFLQIYPQGFESESLVEEGKKHKLRKTSDFIIESTLQKNLDSGLDALEDVVKCVTKSSMVSVFEKVKFKDLIKGITDDEKFYFLDALNENIHGDEEKGFNMLKDFLSKYKLAKWPLMTVFRAYINLDYDVFIKPTTVKKILAYLEYDEIKYSPTPTYEFYTKYRDLMNGLKEHVDSSLYPSNPAFSGFFMIML